MTARSWWGALGALVLAGPSAAQEPAAWGADLVFHTFSIVAIDRNTGETGVAVTTRNPCVGNAVPWVRAGVGAVATQGGTRIEYGTDVLDRMERGMSAPDALAQVVAADAGRESRQVGVIGMDGRTAQHTGSGQYGSERQGDHVAMRTGPTFAVQGNSLVGPEVVEAVARTFQASEGSLRHLGDRLIEALNAGHVLGGDGRHGETQSAAVLVADPREGMSRRPDKVTVDIHVCEAPDPLAEMRRIYDTISETLGFRTLQQEIGNDVIQLKVMLHALGYLKPELAEMPTSGAGANVYDQETVDAVNRFRSDQQWQTTVPGLVDARTIERLWSRLEAAGKATQVRQKIQGLVAVRR
jgi:uncharacterized Ntn-hydrolase superfamily protein